MVIIYKNKMDKISNNKFIISGLFGIISVILLYINNNYIDSKEKTDVMDYVKIFILSVSISFGTIMVLEMNKNKSNISVQTPELKTNTEIEVKTPVSQDIHTGNPNF